MIKVLYEETSKDSSITIFKKVSFLGITLYSSKEVRYVEPVPKPEERKRIGFK